jgi:(5-formylfuran-3-yl)methyl phosphate synthase
MTMKLLVSVRSVDEALLAARGGADFIDLKEPRQGALGALPLATIRDCVAALRPFDLPISATIGDRSDDIAAAVHRLADCGVDLVKVGIEADAASRGVLTMLAGCGRPVVPVLIADRGLDPALVEFAAGLGFAGLMVDTADKGAGSLFDRVPMPALQHFIDSARATSLLCGLAGALRLEDLPCLLALGPDFAGFRSAVCRGDRSGALDPQRLCALRQATSCGTFSPSSNARTESSALL